MLQISSGIEEPGSLRPELVISLAVAWTIVFVALLKGVKSFGKVQQKSYKVQQIIDSIKTKSESGLGDRRIKNS